MKMFSFEGRFECGLDDLVKGKLFAFTPVIPPRNPQAVYGLGVAIANEPGYIPVPLHWVNAETWDEMSAHADELNAAEGHSLEEAARIVCSSMAAGKL